MNKKIKKNLDILKFSTAPKTYAITLDTIDMTAIYFATWIGLLLEDDPIWFQKNSISKTYLLFQAWQKDDREKDA